MTGSEGGIEPPTRVVAQGVTVHCDQIVTLFLANWERTDRQDLSVVLGLSAAILLLDRQHLLRLHYSAGLETIQVLPRRETVAGVVRAIPFDSI